MRVHRQQPFGKRRSLWAAVLPVIALFTVSSPSRADEFRLWKDATGQHSRAAVFVRLADDRVHLKGEDGKPFSVLLSKLSAADQDYVRSLGSATVHDPFENSFADPSRGINPNMSSPSSATDSKDLRVVVVQGVGIDLEAAKKDAHREAVRQVVGALVDAESSVSNDRLLQDKVITLSSAIVQKSETLSSQNEDGLVRIRVKATVRMSPLFEALRSNRVSVNRVDGQSLDAEQATRLDQAQATLELLAKGFPRFHATCFDVQPDGKPTLGKVGAKTTELIVPILISPRLREFTSCAARVDEVLSATARTSGEYVSGGEDVGSSYDRNVRHAARVVGDVFDLPVQREAAKLQWQKIFVICDPKVSEGGWYGLAGVCNLWTHLARDKHTPVLTVMRSSNASGSRTSWKWFAITAEEEKAIRNQISPIARCVVALKDSAGQLLAKDEVRVKQLGSYSLWDNTAFVVSPFTQLSEGAYAPRIKFNCVFKLSQIEVKQVATVESYFEVKPLMQFLDD